ncbi:hypothetical protein F2Q69_00028203 [Brassica cretica]|uniref:Uncharacterized protein n=1 Tax=Brassica cretica TaxID=69181 RepID=A0A8S9S0B1_BRACR|nr:hypothetical protein F2Q69_00028203 [Brassica cretica]
MKSSRPGSRLTESSPMSLPFITDLSVLTTSMKSSRPGSRLTESSPMSLPFITDLSVLVFNQMVLIFHSFKGFSDLEDFWDDLPVSRLKYNALDNFQEVFQTTFRKSSR